MNNRGRTPWGADFANPWTTTGHSAQQPYPRTGAPIQSRQHGTQPSQMFGASQQGDESFSPLPQYPSPSQAHRSLGPYPQLTQATGSQFAYPSLGGTLPFDQTAPDLQPYPQGHVPQSPIIPPPNPAYDHHRVPNEQQGAPPAATLQQPQSSLQHHNNPRSRTKKPSYVEVAAQFPVPGQNSGMQSINVAAPLAPNSSAGGSTSFVDPRPAYRPPLQPRIDTRQQSGIQLNMRRPSNVPLPPEIYLAQENRMNGIHPTTLRNKGATDPWSPLQLAGDPGALDLVPMSRQSSATTTSSTQNSRRSKWEIMNSITEHPCSICGAGFNTSADRMHHERTAHGEKKHPCPQCDKVFSYPKDVVRHQETHMRSRPFLCNNVSCRYSREGFKRQEHLDRHRNGNSCPAR